MASQPPCEVDVDPGSRAQRACDALNGIESPKPLHWRRRGHLQTMELHSFAVHAVRTFGQVVWRQHAA
ncbi:MAG TPA: hypothetical protein VEX62_06655 [Candidatus Limnocylindrales bacterium]|nr:hypothetical protein [Candidatus Limnocylindrales bacterium]